MFHSARIKLTAWYLLIIMFVSCAFSMVIYKVSTLELERLSRMQRFRFERRIQEWPDLDIHPLPPIIEQELIEETKKRLIFNLLFINAGILVISGGLGYFLSGKTLRPIKEMVDEQNRFVTDASHELRTPITAIKTSTEVGLRDKKLTFSQARDLLKENLEEVGQLQSLSDKLLRLANFEKPSGNYHFTAVKLAEIFKEAEEKVRVIAKSKKIELSFSDAHYFIKGEKESLVELLVILLDNAIKYSPSQGKVEVNAGKSDSELVIKVKDEGVGIDEKDLPHIFDRFFRADSARFGMAGGGYGLGLAIAKKIVDIHHGTIKAESKLSEGSTFIVCLPSDKSIRKEPKNSQ